MKRIDLTQNQHTLVDDEDYEALKQWKWSAAWFKNIQSFYAVRHDNTKKNRPLIYIHRQILGLDDHREKVDHLNHNTLDNRRSNIILATTRANGENRRDQSKYGVGISKHKHLRHKPFQVQVCVDGVKTHVGCFATSKEAQRARFEYLKRKGLS